VIEAAHTLAATAVAIYWLLQKSAFGPDDTERLATAYESVLRVLELNDRNDPITEIVARRIIEAAQTGLRDPGFRSARRR
jgi:hypothetical protein